jgi:catechol 2,3-dioxygenase-like lactoylglutathione lyase family enzyme
MIDHVSIPVSDLERSATFYDAVLLSVGWVRRKQLPSAIGYGPSSRAAPVFWILSRREAGSAAPGLGLHVSFEAADCPSVDAFFEAALRHGGEAAGAPGPRPEYTQPFYGAFVFDPDGFKIEAVCRTAAPARTDAGAPE